MNRVSCSQYFLALLGVQNRYEQMPRQLLLVLLLHYFPVSISASICTRNVAAYSNKGNNDCYYCCCCYCYSYYCYYFYCSYRYCYCYCYCCYYYYY